MGRTSVKNMSRRQQKAVFASMGKGSTVSGSNTKARREKLLRNDLKNSQNKQTRTTKKKLGILDKAAKFNIERAIVSTENDIVELKERTKTEKVLKKKHLKEGSTFKAKKNSEKIKKLKSEIKDWEKYKKSLIKDLNKVTG